MCNGSNYDRQGSAARSSINWVSIIEDPEFGLTVFDSKRWSNDPPNVNVEAPSSRHSIWIESPRQYKTTCTVVIDIFLPYDPSKMTEKSSLLSELDDLVDHVRNKIQLGEAPDGSSLHDLIWDMGPNRNQRSISSRKPRRTLRRGFASSCTKSPIYLTRLSTKPKVKHSPGSQSS